ncbi:MAG: hypothetical protein K2Q22_15830 [Cytophagales bacterium]|nr:hypothetical protein [Cytophagales bacterium]
MKYLLLLFPLALSSCDWAKQKTKETVNKTGEVVAKTGSEFVDGVSKGIEKTFQNEVVFSEPLKKHGLSSGKIIIHGTDSSSNNILTTYLIFNGNVDQDITIKVFSDEGQEYGRVKQHIAGVQGEAKYVDFVFDKRTNIDGKGKLIFE